MPKDIFVLNKENVSYNLFFLGMTIAFYGSLNPWFMWPLGQFSAVLACFIVVCSLLISGTMEHSIYNRNHYLPAIIAYIVLVYYQTFVNEMNFTSHVFNLFHVGIFYALFKVDRSGLNKLSTLISKSMGILLTVSMPFFALYILGFPLPSVNIHFGEYYSYSNYFFFLLDDRNLFTIIPRFQSVFLEPGQMGTATALLLLTQTGHWRKWYNIILIIATLISFSLAAYVLFVIAIFLSLWMQGKDIIKKITITVAIIASVVIGSFYYNDGFNLVHDLIVLRLEVEDGEMAGDNRVREDTQAEYETFLQSSDIIVGKNFERQWGGAGYKMYLLDYGIVGIFLLVVFYGISLYSPHPRAYLSALIIGTLNFIVRDFPLWYAYYIPLLCTSHIILRRDNDNDNSTEESS
jgi:hypothetical protein